MTIPHKEIRCPTCGRLDMIEVPLEGDLKAMVIKASPDIETVFTAFGLEDFVRKLRKELEDSAEEHQY